MNTSTKTAKQNRLDNYELRELFPALRFGQFWACSELIKARRASQALYAADVRLCNDINEEAAQKSRERAEKRAAKSIEPLNRIIAEALKRVNVCGIHCRIQANGGGFRFLQITDGVRAYGLID